MTDAVSLPEAPALSQVERVVDTFIAPSKTFTDVLRSTSWWLPFLILVVLSYLLAFGIAQKVGWTQLAQNEIHSNPKAEERLANASPAQIAAQEKIMTYSFKGTFYAAPLVNLLFLALIAVVLWPTINFLFAGKATYGQVFCVLNYAWLPASLKSLVALLLLYLGNGADTFTTENMVGSNPGYYIQNAGALKTFLTSFDIFNLWMMVVLAIGLAIVARTKRSNGFIAVFGWWLLIVLFKTGMAAVMG